MRTVYIAGPMTGYKYFNFPAFDEWKDTLLCRGYNVISPADLDREVGFDAMKLPEDSDWTKWGDALGEFDLDACIERDVEAVKKCDIIFMLKGWENSTGAKAEKALAEWMGKEVRYEEEPKALLPSDSKARLEYPIFTGFLMYFPHACMAVARHSFIGNEQHNPGEPMHWAKEKSIGDGNQIVRHVMEGDLEACAWRALELLERKLTGLPPFDGGSKHEAK